MVSVCASVRPNMSREIIKNRAAEANFYVFCYNFGCRPPIWILKRLAESSEHADSESIFKFSLLKDSKAVKTTFGPVCLCESQPFLPVRQSPEKKLRPFEITSSKKWYKFIFNDMIRNNITNLPVCVKLLYKVCSQSYHDVIIKKSY